MWTEYRERGDDEMEDYAVRARGFMPAGRDPMTLYAEHRNAGPQYLLPGWQSSATTTQPAAPLSTHAEPILLVIGFLLWLVIV